MFSPSLVAKQKTDLVGLRADEARELPADLVGLLQHLVERDRLRRLAFGKDTRSVGHRKRNRRDVRGVQVQDVPYRREIGADSERIVLIARRTLPRQRQKCRGLGRYF